MYSAFFFICVTPMLTSDNEKSFWFSRIHHPLTYRHNFLFTNFFFLNARTQSVAHPILESSTLSNSTDSVHQHCCCCFFFRCCSTRQLLALSPFLFSLLHEWKVWTFLFNSQFISLSLFCSPPFLSPEMVLLLKFSGGNEKCIFRFSPFFTIAPNCGLFVVVLPIGAISRSLSLFCFDVIERRVVIYHILVRRV